MLSRIGQTARAWLHPGAHRPASTQRYPSARQTRLVPCAVMPPAPPPTYRTLPSLKGTTAIYGGSFNPPHVGHAWVCDYLVRTRHADAVWLLPVFKHSEGKALAPFTDRLALCRSLERPDGKVRVQLTEQEMGGVDETSEVIAYLQARHPGRRFVLVLGADLMASVHLWAGWGQIVRRVPIEAVPRPGYPGDGDASAGVLMSSSEVRRRLGRGESIAGCVAPEVERYISERGLYRGDGGDRAAAARPGGPAENRNPL